MDDKLDILDLGLGSSGGIQCKLVSLQEPPAELLAFLRLLNCSDEDAFHLEALFRNEAWDHMLRPISSRNELMVCETMIAGCQDALQAYQTLPGSPGSSSTDPLAMVYKVCSEERKALEWIMEWFMQRKDSLPSLEYYAERRLKDLKLLDEDGQSTFEDMILGN